ncbi:MAG TPA: hypothetical protein PLW35_14080, partial [Verrucomicrobiota bacterium]|nr:hypothetical protein [Verrucomicrobiota bacterium]
LHAMEKATALGSAAVLGRTNPMADRAPVSVRQIRRPIFDRPGAAKNRRAPARAGKGNGARERGRPRPHQPDGRAYAPFRSRKCGVRTFTGRACTNNVPVALFRVASQGRAFVTALLMARQADTGNLTNLEA